MPAEEVSQKWQHSAGLRERYRGRSTNFMINEASGDLCGVDAIDGWDYMNAIHNKLGAGREASMV